MKSILITILLSGIILLGASSCATVPKEPLAPGELRLSSIDVLGGGVVANSAFVVNVFFQAAGNPQIKQVCFSESGEGPYCFDVSATAFVTLGTKTAFQVRLPGLTVGSHRVECHAEYIRDGETRKTNTVFIQILAASGARG